MMSMRFYYTKEELFATYENILATIRKHFNNRNISAALLDIRRAALLQYKINNIVSDNRILELCLSLSDSIFTKYMDFIPNEDVILFYDAFTWDNHGESQQYLDAILALPHKQLVFVNEKKHDCISNNIYRLLEENEVELFELGNENDDLSKIKLFRKIVERKKPAKAFFHLSPHTMIPFVSIGKFDRIIKYQINLTDHAFWIGDGSFFNFSLEFREYGCNLSNQKRGFKKNQILYLPYYPWVEKATFLGFPVCTVNHKILFSGGAMHKIEGGDDKFFLIVKRILDANPNVFFLYAGDGNRTHFYDFIKSNHYEHRIYLLGNRPDIGEVFKRIDLYLGTYPIGGGLMIQYAATYGKPLLVYRNKSAEEVLCVKKKIKFVFDEIDDLVKEATRLFNDNYYYNERSDLFKSLVISQEEFRSLFIKAINGLTPQTWNEQNVVLNNYDDLLRINKDGYEVDKIILSYAAPRLKLKIICNYLLSVPSYYNRILAAIKRRFNG